VKLLNVVARKSDNATVLAADTVKARQAQDDGLADRQHGAREITSRHDILPRSVVAKRHQAALDASRFATANVTSQLTSHLT
jgi:hypothetical protein